MDFDSPRSPSRPAHAAAKPDPNKSTLQDALSFMDANQGSTGIEELSERLVSLADQINQSNAARRSNSTSPARAISDTLPSIFRAIARRSEPQTFTRDVDLIVDRQSAELDNLPKRPPEFDANGRLWPQVPMPKVSTQALEDRLAAQSAELDRRNLEIAELCVMRQGQAAELKAAHGEIECLRASIAELQQIAAQLELKARAETQNAVRCESEKTLLVEQLNEQLNEKADLSHRLLDVEATFNDAIVDVAAHEETIARLKAELIAAQAETERRVAEAEEKADMMYVKEHKRQEAAFESKLRENQVFVEERDRHIAKLETLCGEIADCCNNLSKKVLELEDVQKVDKAALQSQQSHIDFLEAVNKVERENSEAKMKALIKEFERERVQFYVKEQESAEIRKNIVELLPKLVARDKDRAEPKPDVIPPQSQVA